MNTIELADKELAELWTGSKSLREFAEKIRADERERCAKELDKKADSEDEVCHHCGHNCAARLRNMTAGGEHE